jgi:hypothetical protein
VKSWLKNLLLGIPLALGAMLTLVGVVLIFDESQSLWVGATVGLLGIPLLFATLTALLSEP